MPRHLAPSPGYPHPYPYLIRGFPDTAALENRQTLLNDYITSQQMHQWPAAAAMAAQRSDLLRGLSPRDQPLPLPYSTAPRGTFLRPLLSCLKIHHDQIRCQIDPHHCKVVDVPVYRDAIEQSSSKAKPIPFLLPYPLL